MGIAAKTPDLALLGENEITVDAIDFNGTSSYIQYSNQGWTYDVDPGDDMTISFWVKPDLGANETGAVITSGTPGTLRQYIYIQSNASSQVRAFFRFSTNGASDGITYASSYGSLTNNSWNHVLFSYQDSGNTLEVAINDTDQSASNAENGTNNFPTTETANTQMGRSAVSTNHLDACVTEFWMKNQYYDASVESQRRKFISSNSKPVQLPTSPLVYLTGSSSTWSNTGSTSLGTQTLNNITDCADSPSD